MKEWIPVQFVAYAVPLFSSYHLVGCMYVYVYGEKQSNLRLLLR